MTEQEIDNAIANYNNLLSSLGLLEQRVQILEQNLVPKSSYFQQIKESFEKAPECCTTTAPPPDGCVCSAGGTNSIKLKRDADGLPLYLPTFIINEIPYNPAVGDSSMVDYVPQNILTIVSGFTYESDGVTRNRYFHFTNVSSEPLCVQINMNPLYVGTPENFVIEAHISNESPYVLSQNNTQINFCLIP